MLTRNALLACLLLSWVLPPSAWPAPTEAVAEWRGRIDASLIDFYGDEARRNTAVEKVEFLDRDGGRQPIRIRHHRKLADAHRILVIAMDDGIQPLYAGQRDTVFFGIPMADRIKDLLPQLPDSLPEESPLQAQARVTVPGAHAMIAFIKDRVLPFAEKEYGGASGSTLRRSHDRCRDTRVPCGEVAAVLAVGEWSGWR